MFRGTLYCLASETDLAAFLTHPGRYLGTAPRIPCRVCIVGTPFCDVSTHARALANQFGVAYVNVAEELERMSASEPGLIACFHAV